MTHHTSRGHIAIFLLGPLLAVALLSGLVVWLIGSNWTAFPPAAQKALQVVGVIALVGFFVTSARNGGSRRGF